MIESAYTRDEYIQQYSILRNPRFWRVFSEARARCMDCAIAGGDYKTVPLYSHDATYQSVFTNGWMSVTEQDIRLYKAVLNSKRYCHEKVA